MSLNSFDLSAIQMNLNAILSLKTSEDLMSHEDIFPSLKKAYHDSFVKHATTLYQECPEQFISLWKDKSMYDLACMCNVDAAIDRIIFGTSGRYCVEWYPFDRSETDTTVYIVVWRGIFTCRVVQQNKNESVNPCKCKSCLKMEYVDCV
jgi:hypothetical protein